VRGNFDLHPKLFFKFLTENLSEHETVEKAWKRRGKGVEFHGSTVPRFFHGLIFVMF
jgi:hypothetical protein